MCLNSEFRHTSHTNPLNQINIKMSSPPTRFHFKSDIKYDIALLSEVESTNPYQVSTVKSGVLWKEVASNLQKSNLAMPVDYRKCRERVNLLLKEHNGKEALSIKASGIAEPEMTELIRLLTSVSSLDEMKPKCSKHTMKRSIAEATRDKALGEMEDEEAGLMQGFNKEDMTADDLLSERIKTTQEKLDGGQDQEHIPNKRIKTMGIRDKEQIVAYLKDKSQKELDFKREELVVRTAENENKKIELQLLKERQDAELLERKHWTSLRGRGPHGRGGPQDRGATRGGAWSEPRGGGGCWSVGGGGGGRGRGASDNRGRGGGSDRNEYREAFGGSGSRGDRGAGGNDRGEGGWERGGGGSRGMRGRGVDSRGGGAFQDRGRGSENRGGGGGGRGSGGGGGGATLSQASEILPLDVTNRMMDLAPLGWNTVKALMPPPALPPGNKLQKTIGIRTNNMRTHITLPDKIYQYDVDIDLSVESKERRKAAKARRAAEPQPTTQRGRGSGSRGRGGNSQSRAGPSQRSGNKDPPRPKLWKKIMKVFVRRFEVALLRKFKNSVRLASDFSKAIYSTIPLPKIGRDGKAFDVPMSEIPDEDPSDSYTCVITLVAEIPTGNLQFLVEDIYKFFTECQPLPQDFANLTTLDRIYSIVFKTLPSCNFTAVGRSSFFSTPTDQGFDISGGLVNWTGFSLIFNMGWKTFINVDVANSAFLKDQTVYEALDSLFTVGTRDYAKKEADPRNIGTMSDRHFEKAEKLLRTCQVEYQTSKGGKMRGRVREVSWKIASANTFIDSNGRETNVQEYFRETYNKILQYEHGLCLCIRRDSIVPAEFCRITKGQVWNQKLNEAQTAQLIRDTAKAPNERLKKIKEGIQHADFSEDAVLKQFGVTVETQLHVLEKARVLPPPTLTYASDRAGRQTNLTPKHGDGVWNMWNHPVQFAVPSSTVKNKKVSWAVINFGGCSKVEVKEFVALMVRFMEKGGLHADTEDEVMGRYEQLRFDPKGVKRLLTKFQNEKCMFVFVILPQKDNFMYATVKEASEILMQGGVLTQCCLANSITKKGKDQTASNIILKLNMKLGGTNYVLGMGRAWEKVDILQAPVMIVGADVTHPGIDSKYPSLAAVTASCDRTGMPYRMHCQAQKKADRGAAEVIDGLELIMVKFITEFIMATGHKPRRILYYRDGVGEGQFGEVLQKEMLAIRAACEIISKERIMDQCFNDIKLGERKVKYEPGITFIAVQKRHKVRFFVTDPKDGVGKPGNCPPGTIVDTEIVSSTMTNFYLLSHTGIQGTSRPTHYQLQWDDCNFKMDELQILTYYLCYMYCRCNRSVSYPAPTYYAHLAATRAKVFTTLCNDDELQSIQLINTRINRNKEFTDGFPMHFV